MNFNFYVKEAYTCNTITFNIEADNINYNKLRNKIIFEWHLKFRDSIYYFDIIECGHGEEYDPITVINFDILYNMRTNNMLSFYIKFHQNINNMSCNINQSTTISIPYDNEQVCEICYNSNILLKICENNHMMCHGCYHNITTRDDTKCPFCRVNMLNNIEYFFSKFILIN